MAPRIHLYICLLLATARTSLSFTAQSVRSLSCSGIYSDPSHHNLISIRGGDQDISNDNDCSTTSAKNSQMSAIAAFVMAGAHHYSKALERNPIVTKSMTASFVFVASDLLAQYIEKGTDNNKKLDKKRTVGASLVGLLYFGPAAHFWYENIFRLFPGTSLFSTLQKAAMGQIFFGPSFTCIFFATSLMQAGNFTLGNWARKIKSDLFGAWLAGVGFWPVVDLISFSLIPKRWIPLFINVCSLIWNVYLSIVANRKGKGVSK